MKIKANFNYHGPNNVVSFVKDKMYEVIDDENKVNYMYCEELKVHLVDPIIHGLILFRHEDAPNPTKEETIRRAKLIMRRWDVLNSDEDADIYDFIDTTFPVQCWKNFEEIPAGFQAIAHVDDFYGSDCNAFTFIFEDVVININNVENALNHFVLV